MRYNGTVVRKLLALVGQILAILEGFRNGSSGKVPGGRKISVLASYLGIASKPRGAPQE